MTSETKNQEGEIWKDFNNHYEVSSYGRVRSRDRFITKKDGKTYNIKGILLKQVDNQVGYKQVSLGRSIKSITVHRLVGELFIPNPEKKLTINHKDGNKHNNHVSNLEWNTYAENNKHAILLGLNKPCGSKNPPYGVNHWNSSLDVTQVKTILICHNDGISISDLASYFKMSRAAIHKVIKRDTWKHVSI
jgi:hypothetical protein